MDTKSPLVVNLTLDWRTLVLLALAGCVLFRVTTIIRAQADNPPDANAPQVEAVQVQTASLPETKLDLTNPPGEGYLPSANGEWIAPGETRIAGADSPVTPLATTSIKSGRLFYLTKTQYQGKYAYYSCASGFHMASLWEILDVSNINYDFNNPEAYTKKDSGYGPPSDWYGWIRTGYDDSNTNVAGHANCNTWTSISANDFGSIAQLSDLWVTAPGEIFTWDVAVWICSGLSSAWCIED